MPTSVTSVTLLFHERLGSPSSVPGVGLTQGCGGKWDTRSPSAGGWPGRDGPGPHSRGGAGFGGTASLWLERRLEEAGEGQEAQ